MCFFHEWDVWSDPYHNGCSQIQTRKCKKCGIIKTETVTTLHDWKEIDRKQTTWLRGTYRKQLEVCLIRKCQKCGAEDSETFWHDIQNPDAY